MIQVQALLKATSTGKISSRTKKIHLAQTQILTLKLTPNLTQTLTFKKSNEK